MRKHKTDESEPTPEEVMLQASADAAVPVPSSEPAVDGGASGPVEEPFAAPTAPAQIAELKENAEKARDYYDRLLRLTADFDNFRKRAARERQEAIKFANENLLEKLVPVLDNFEMALGAAEGGAGAATVQSLQTGINMIHQQLRGTLADAGLEEINAAAQPFDPNLHEAVAMEESATVPEGNVVRQLRKGYRLRERLIRPATVVVAKPPSA